LKAFNLWPHSSNDAAAVNAGRSERQQAEQEHRAYVRAPRRRGTSPQGFPKGWQVQWRSDGGRLSPRHASLPSAMQTRRTPRAPRPPRISRLWRRARLPATVALTFVASHGAGTGPVEERPTNVPEPIVSEVQPISENPIDVTLTCSVEQEEQRIRIHYV